MRRSRQSHPQPFAKGAGGADDWNGKDPGASDLQQQSNSEKNNLQPRVGELDGQLLDGFSELPSPEGGKETVTGEVHERQTLLKGANELHGSQTPLNEANELHG